MKTLGIAAGCVVCAVATSAFAEAPPPAYQANPPLPPEATSPRPGTPIVPPSETARDLGRTQVRAPKGALELGVEAGYTQGFGAATSDPRMGAGAGGTVGLRIDDRIDPRWSFGVNAQYERYGAGARREAPATLQGMNAGVHATYHASPYSRVDPHVTFGAGWRLLAESPLGAAPTMFHGGIEIGKVQVGVDLRPSESVSVSPVIGADLNLFAWHFGGGAMAAPPLGTSLNAFVFAGVQGRFDVGGTRESRPLP